MTVELPWPLAEDVSSPTTCSSLESSMNSWSWIKSSSPLDQRPSRQPLWEGRVMAYMSLLLVHILQLVGQEYRWFSPRSNNINPSYAYAHAMMCHDMICLTMSTCLILCSCTMCLPAEVRYCGAGEADARRLSEPLPVP